MLCLLGAYRLIRAAPHLQPAKTMSVAGLTLGEWFGMWVSHQWNGVPYAFHIVMILYAVLILLIIPDNELRQAQE